MKKLRKFHWIIVGCCATVALTVSVFVFLHLSASANDRVNDSSAQESEALKTQGLEQSSQANLIHLTPQEALDEIVQIDSNFRRTASLYTYLKEVDERDLIDLLHRTENIERASVRSDIQTVLVRKIASVDPKQALDWIIDVPKIRRAPLLTRLFSDWSIVKLDEAIEGAKSLSRTDRHIAQEAILSTREDLSSPTLLDIAQQLGLEEFALRQISATQTHKLLETPSAAWDLLVNDSVKDAKQLDMFQLVASTWKEHDGLDVLLRAATVFPHEEDRIALSKVIEAVVGDELGQAFEYVQNLSPDDRGELPAALVLAAARANPDVTLKEIERWSDDPIHTQLQRIAATTWAQTDPRGMLNKLEQVPQFTRANALKIAFTHLAYVSPTEAIQNLERANEFLSAKTLLPAIIAKQWSRRDPEAALQWSISYAGSNNALRERLVMNVFRQLIVSDVERALEISKDIRSTYLSGLPEATYDVVETLGRMGKIEEAIALLPKLDINGVHFAILDLGWRLVEASEPYAAIELGANIPSPDPSIIISGPATYFNGVFGLWASRDPQQLFNSLQSFTSPLLRSMAARALVDKQGSRPALSEESVAYAKALLDEYPLTKNLHLLELQLQDEKGLIDLDKLVLPPDFKE